MSSPCRITSLLVLKESDGRIAYKSREKEDSLSLKMGEQTFCIPFPSSSLRFPFLFAFLFLYSHFSSHFAFTFSSISLLLWSFFSPFLEKSSFGQWEEIASSFPQTKVWLSLFHISFSYLFMTSSPTWLHVSHGIPFPTHGSL